MDIDDNFVGSFIEDLEHEYQNIVNHESSPDPGDSQFPNATDKNAPAGLSSPPRRLIFPESPRISGRKRSARLIASPLPRVPLSPSDRQHSVSFSPHVTFRPVSPKEARFSDKFTIFDLTDDDDSADDADYIPSADESDSDESTGASDIESDKEDSYKDSTSVTFQDRLSFSLSDMDSQDENILVAILNGFISWIKSIFHFVFFVLCSMLKQFLRASFKQGLVFKGILVGVLICISIYIVGSASTAFMYDHGVFEPSPHPPRDMADLSSRLVSIENEVTALSRLKSRVKNTDADLIGIHEQINSIVARVSSLSDSKALTSKWESESAMEIRRLEASISDFDRRLTETWASLENEHEERESENSATRVSLASLEGDFSKTKQKIQYLNERVGQLERAKLAETQVLDILDKYLPSRVAVRYDPDTGEYSASPEFWKFLSTQLALRGITHDSPSGSPAIDFSFDEFIRLNERAIHDYLNNYIDASLETKGVKDSAALVSKEIFKEILGDQLASIREETVDAIAKLDRDFRRSIKTVSDEQRRLANSYEDNSTRSPIHEFNSTQVAMDLMIKKALQRYVAHTISKPDFADPASGAKINLRLTSSSYNWHDRLDFPSRQMYGFLGTLGFGRMKVNRPTMAFNNDVSLGFCWPFTGRTGQVALNLGTTINPTDIGIVHVRPEQSPNPSSAPRKVSLWIQISDAETRARVRTLVGNDLDNSRSSSADHTHKAQNWLLPSSLSSPGVPIDYVKILDAEYQLDGGDEFQVFPVPLSVRNLHLATSKVIFKIDDNWGNEDFTCIYRLRLFGDKVVQKKEEQHQQQHVHTEDDHDLQFYDEEPSQSSSGGILHSGISSTSEDDFDAFGDDESF